MGTAVTFYMGRAALEARIGVPGVMSTLWPARGAACLVRLVIRMLFPCGIVLVEEINC
jgi:hypothetical protein